MGTFDLNEALRESGIKAESLDRIRLARGVVGKTSYVAAATMGVLAIVAWGLKSDTFALLGVVGAALVLFFGYFIGVIRFATKNPALALLEGAELLKWRQLDIAAKGIEPSLNAQSVIPPAIEPDKDA